MKWFLYTDGVAFSGDAFGKGLKKLGHEFQYRNPMAWHDSEFRACDIAVVFGWRENQQACLKSNIARGIPTVVLDLGYVDRFEDGVDSPPDCYLQLSIGDRLNLIPQFPCPPDRLAKLNLRYPGKKNNPDGYALFCGQWPTDAAHPFRDELSIKEFVDELRRRVPHVEIKYRAHPRLVRNPVNRTALESDLAGARCVLTWNSNSGHDALREGIPVFCDVSAPYSELASALQSTRQLEKRISDPPFPIEAQWNDYFQRLAYGQWTFSELATGEPQEFILKHIQSRKDMRGKPDIKFFRDKIRE